MIALIVLGPKRLPRRRQVARQGPARVQGRDPGRDDDDDDEREARELAAIQPVEPAKAERREAEPVAGVIALETARVRDRSRSVPRVRGAACVVFALLVFAAPASAAETKYSLANGCYRAVGVPGGEAVRMQATTLGRYLLYRPDRTFVAAQPRRRGAGAAPEPRRRLAGRRGAGGAFTLTPQSGGAGARRRPLRARDRLRRLPRGRARRDRHAVEGRDAVRPVGGLIDGHMHWMTFEYLGGNFHCGRPWHPYGIAVALPDCASIEGPEGVAAPFQNFLNYGNPVQPHDTRGYPKLTAVERRPT